MNFLFNKLFGTDDKNPRHEKLNAATANNALKFLSFGLTYGATSLRDRYQPASKVNEFVAVSGQILTALHRHCESRLASESVILAMHVNDHPQQVTLTQVGQNVMLALDSSSTIITHTTLAELYANLRNDIITHEDIYGVALQSLAQSLAAA